MVVQGRLKCFNTMIPLSPFFIQVYRQIKLILLFLLLSRLMLFLLLLLLLFFVISCSNNFLCLSHVQNWQLILFAHHFIPFDLSRSLTNSLFYTHTQPHTLAFSRSYTLRLNLLLLSHNEILSLSISLSLSLVLCLFFAFSLPYFTFCAILHTFLFLQFYSSEKSL